MAATDVFKANIVGIDKFTAVMRPIARAMSGLIGLQRKSTEASKEAGSAGERYFATLGAHVKLLHGHFGGLNASISKVHSSLTSLVPALGALGAGGSLAGLFALVDKTATGAAKSAADKAKVGGSVAPYKFAAVMNEVDPDSLVPAFEKLNKGMSEAVGGNNKSLAHLFAQLKISMKDAKGNALNFADVMPQLADAFKNTTNEAMRNKMAVALFGKAGNDLLPMLMQGGEALRKYAEEGKKLGYADATKEEEAGLKKYHTSMLKMGAAVSGFQKAIGSKLAPVLEPIVTAMSDWVAANKDWLATEITNKVKVLADYAKTVDFGGILRGLIDWTTLAAKFVFTNGRLISIIGGLTLVLGSPLMTALENAAAGIKLVGMMLRGVALIAMANPFLAIATLIAGAALVIYEKWDPAKGFFENILGGITGAFKDAWSVIKPIVDAMVAAANWVTDGWVGRHIGLPDGGQTAGQQEQIDTESFTFHGGKPGPRAAPVSPYSPGSPAAPSIIPGGRGAGQTDGQVNVRVDFANTPPGTRVQSTSSGAAAPPDMNIGFSDPLSAY